MAKKMKRSTTEDESSPSSSASSSDEDISREETARSRRRRSLARRKTSKKERSSSQGKEIMKFLAEVKEEVCKQSKQFSESKEDMSKQLEKLREEMCKQSRQVTESKEEMYKQLDKLREEICKQSKQVTESKEMYKQLDKLREEMGKQSKQATESKEEICKQLEKDNQEMRKQLTEILTDLRKQWDLRTNGSSGDDSDAPRSQWNQVQPPRYRLVFKSGMAETIEKGQIIDISVTLVDGSSEQTVENGPLASATVELVVVDAQFNQHNNQYNWSRQDFESNIIKKARERNSATGDVDRSVKSIVSNGRFNLVQGFMCHRGFEIFNNSGNKKVRLGVMVVSPTEVRVLEGLSNPFFVRGHDRPNRQSNLRMNRSNTQRQALVENGYQEQISTTPNMQNPSWSNPIQAGGRTRQALVYNGYQLQNGQTPNLQNPISPSSTQIGGIRLNTSTRQLQLPDLSSGLNINEQQFAFLGDTPMLSAEPSTSQEQRASIEPHLPMMPQATNNEIGTPPYYTIQRTFPVRLIWDRLNVEPIKNCWNLRDHLSLTTVYKPSNRKLLPNSTRQLFLSRLSLKGQSLTLQTLSCTKKENCLLLKGHLYQEELPDGLSMLYALGKLEQISDYRQHFFERSDYRQLHRQRLITYMQNGFRSQEYMPVENIQWSHAPLPTLEALECHSLSLWRMNLSLGQHLTKLHLFGVMSCEELPQFCQLLVLQILCLEKLQSLCSDVVSMPFPELRELRLHDLQSLDKWVATEGKEEQLIFPLLEKIVIKKCPKLTRLPEAPKLKDIELDDDKSPLFIALVKLRHMSSVSTTGLSSHDTEATRPHQIDQNLDSSLSELNLKELAHEVRDVSHASFKQSTQRNDVRPGVAINGVVV